MLEVSVKLPCSTGMLRLILHTATRASGLKLVPLVVVEVGGCGPCLLEGDKVSAACRLAVYLATPSGAAAICCVKKLEKLSSKTPSFLHVIWASAELDLPTVLTEQIPAHWGCHVPQNSNDSGEQSGIL